MNRSTATNIMRLLLAVALLWVSTAQGHGAYCPYHPPTGNPGCQSDSASQSNSNGLTGAGNPINLTSGNTYQEETDIAFPGEASIGFRRHYNSLGSRVGVLGRGWPHTYET